MFGRCLVHVSPASNLLGRLTSMASGRGEVRMRTKPTPGRYGLPRSVYSLAATDRRRPSRAPPAPGRGTTGAGRARSPLPPRSGHPRRARTGIGGVGAVKARSIGEPWSTLIDRAANMLSQRATRHDRAKTTSACRQPRTSCSSSKGRALGRSRRPGRKNPHRGERWRGRESVRRERPPRPDWKGTGGQMRDLEFGLHRFSSAQLNDDRRAGRAG